MFGRAHFLWAVLLVAAAMAAQEKRVPADPDAPSLLSEVPSVPGVSAKLRGLNAGVALTAVHDSSAGWYTVMTPAVAYTVSPRYSVDLSMPVYLYRLAEDSATVTTTVPGGPGQPPRQVQTTTTSLKPQRWEPGDVVLAVHGNFSHKWMLYTLTPSMTMPSGDSEHGLSTGRVTFDLDNHFIARTRAVDFVLDLGGGDSSNLVNRLVTKDYTSLGPLAHFQAGVQAPLPWRASFQAVAYEQLPIGDNKIYQTVREPGRPPQQVVTGRSVSEDNGFTNTLIVPLTRRMSLVGYYNRSLRLHLDDVAMGVTFVLRAQGEWKQPRSLLEDVEQ